MVSSNKTMKDGDYKQNFNPYAKSPLGYIVKSIKTKIFRRKT